MYLRLDLELDSFHFNSLELTKELKEAQTSAKEHLAVYSSVQLAQEQSLNQIEDLQAELKQSKSERNQLQQENAKLRKEIKVVAVFYAIIL